MYSFPDELTTVLKKNAPLAVALSGGIDSRFLCFSAKSIHIDLLAIHVTGPHIPAGESQFAITWAEKHDIPIICLEHPLFQQESLQNTRDRCYICKKRLIEAIKNLLKRNHDLSRRICDGSNLDDLKVYRPGKKALLEEQILSPLQMAHLSKKDIRELAKKNGLEDPDQPSNACLLTRFPYDMWIQKDQLHRTGLAEEEIRQVFQKQKLNLPFRLRLMPEPVLQIAAIPEDCRDTVRSILERYAFFNPHIYMSDQISGFFDRELPRSTSLPFL